MLTRLSQFKVSPKFERKLFDQTYGHLSTREQLKEYYKTAHWRDKRHEALVYHNYNCMDCGTRLLPGDRDTNIHHTNYKSLWAEIIGRDVVPLCRECHNARHFTLQMRYVPAPDYDERDYFTFVHSSY